MKKSCYLLVTADKYELPVCVGDTIEELSCCTGLTWTSLQRGALRNSLIAGKYRIYKIDDVRSDEERFNDVSDYKQFCIKHNLRENNFKSLEAYHKYIYEEQYV